MPDSMQVYMDSCESKDREKVLKVLAELTERSGISSALNTVNTAILYKATNPDSLINLYRRTYMDVPPLPPIEPPDSFPLMKVIPFLRDLEALEAYFREYMGWKNDSDSERVCNQLTNVCQQWMCRAISTGTGCCNYLQNVGATTYKTVMQQPAFLFYNFLQKGLAKNNMKSKERYAGNCRSRRYTVPLRVV